MIRKNLQNIVTVFLFFVSSFAYGQTDRYGPEQKIAVMQNFPSAVRPGSEFIMEIKISKGNVTGLAKFQQFVPAGMTAAAVNSAGADFSFESQNVKLIWTSVPQNADITLRYKITVASTLQGKKYLSGTFSYVENDRTKKASLVPKEIEITPTAPVAEIMATQSEPVETQPEKTQISSATQQAEEEAEEKKDAAIADASPAGSTNGIVETKKQAEEAAPPAETTAPASTASNSDESKAQPVETPDNVTAPVNSGITFKVQIAAMHEKRFRRKNYFQEQFGLQMEVVAEEHEGLKKYTVGNFTSYAQARKLKDEISTNAEGCFVVAYKNGVRIQVAEAIEMQRGR